MNWVLNLWTNTLKIIRSREESFMEEIGGKKIQSVRGEIVFTTCSALKWFGIWKAIRFLSPYPHTKHHTKSLYFYHPFFNINIILSIVTLVNLFSFFFLDRGEGRWVKPMTQEKTLILLWSIKFWYGAWYAEKVISWAISVSC